MDEQLKVYIQQKLASGASVSEIRTELLNNNWDGEKIDALYRDLGISVESDSSESSLIVAPINTTKAKKPVLINVAILFGLLVFLTSSVAAGYFLIDAVFGNKAPYSEDNLVSGIVASLQKMETFTYSVSSTLEMEERDADAKPFEFQSPSTLEEYKAKYRRDYKRVEAASSILRQLSYGSMRSSQEFPKNLKDLNNSEFSVIENNLSTIDPLTNVEYRYVASQDNFELQITFETAEAISAIRKYNSYSSSPEQTKIDGFTVTFTKESGSYLYLPSSLPKPYHEQLSDMLVYLPPEMYFKISISAVTDLTKENPDLKVSIDGEGDFGDLVYKFAGDILKKDEYWYLRIRNMPSLFSGFFAYEKGEWIRASNDWLEKNTGRSLIPVGPSIVPSEKQEDRYKQNRDELGRFATAVMKIADEEKVLLVKEKPVKEVVDDRKLYRYNLAFNGDTIVRFIERVIEEAQKYEVTRNSDLVNDVTLLEYLKSEEFKAVFNYYNENINLSLLVNKEGFIESVEYSIRAIPDDEVKQLANKQARFKVSIGFSDINKPVEIIAPEEFKEIDDIMNAQKDAYSRYSGNASIKQFLSNTRSTAELVYNTGGYSYAKVCDDERIISSMKSAQENYSKDEAEVRRNIPPKEGVVSCLSGSDWYVIQSPLISSEEELFEYWCVDSTGSSGGNINMLTIADTSCPQ